MRRPVSVKWFVHFIVEQDFLFAESPTVATLPSAFFNERLSLGASWVFSVQPVLPPVYRPPVPFLRMEVGPGD
jgi:hypothetical protein